MIISHLFFGVIAVVVGVIMLKYNFQLTNSVGRMFTIESYLGPGSTFLVYKLLALLIIISGILYASGLYLPVARFIFSPLKSLLPSSQK